MYNDVHRLQPAPTFVASKNLTDLSLQAVANDCLAHLATSRDPKPDFLPAVRMEMNRCQRAVSLAAQPIATQKFRAMPQLLMSAQSLTRWREVPHPGSLAFRRSAACGPCGDGELGLHGLGGSASERGSHGSFSGDDCWVEMCVSRQSAPSRSINFGLAPGFDQRPQADRLRGPGCRGFRGQCLFGLWASRTIEDRGLSGH